MKLVSPILRPPPHLSMDEYAAWNAALLKDITPEQAKRQKQLEERIEKPFVLHDNTEQSGGRLDRP